VTPEERAAAWREFCKLVSGNLDAASPGVMAEPFDRLGECKVFDLSDFCYVRGEDAAGTSGGNETRVTTVRVVHRPTRLSYRVRRKAPPLAVQRGRA